MKKVLAVFLTLVMLVGVFAFSSSAENNDPTVTIVTNQGSPVQKDDVVNFTVRFDNFTPIKGVDVTVTLSGGTLNTTVTSSGFKDGATANENYTVNGNEIRFVNLLEDAQATAKLVFSAKAPAETAEINVVGKYAKSGTELFNITTTPGVFEVSAKVTEETITAAENATEITSSALVNTNEYFIPSGGIFKNNGTDEEPEYVFATKQANGTFKTDDAISTYTYQKYELPDNGITTFGIQNDVDHPALIRFGNYVSENYNPSERDYGMMLFEGDWLAVKNHYISKGYTVQEFVEAFYNNAYSLLNGKDATHVKYTFNGKDFSLYLFKQENFMWKDETNGILEYTMRLHGASNNVYTGIAYNTDKNGANPIISENVKSIKVD